MSLKFSAFQLIIGEKKPKISDFDEYCQEKYNTDQLNTRVTTEKVNDHFYWIYIEMGSPFPYSQEAYDKKKAKVVSNPRTKNQAEYNKQLFCLYDFELHVFYFSNSNQKAFIQEYLKKKTKKDVVIKRFFKSPNEFIEQLKTIDTISFTSSNNLYSESKNIFQGMDDIFGLGQPESFKVEVKYNERLMTQFYKNTFKSLFAKEKSHEISSLVCIGKDDNNVESLFDISSFTQTVHLNLKKDTDGMYNVETLKHELVAKLNGE